MEHEGRGRILCCMRRTRNTANAALPPFRVHTLTGSERSTCDQLSVAADVPGHPTAARECQLDPLDAVAGRRVYKRDSLNRPEKPMPCWFRTALALPLLLAAGSALAQAPANPTQRLRGTVESFDGGTLVMTERSGETLRLALDEKFTINEVVPIELAAILPGSFIGAAAMPQPDGTQRALEVLVFPEAARGSGEGHYPWDLQPGSTMTNATVADLAASADGRTLKLRYKDGEKTLLVPQGVPVVTFKPGDSSLLVPGAKVMVTAQLRDGRPVALRALAGRNGFQPPM